MPGPELRKELLPLPLWQRSRTAQDPVQLQADQLAGHQSACWSPGRPTGCPGQWWSPHPWRGSKPVWMWHLRTWFSRHGGLGLEIGLDDLGGLFQP